MILVSGCMYALFFYHQMFTLDSVIPRFPLTCITSNARDLAICCPTGIYIIVNPILYILV